MEYVLFLPESVFLVGLVFWLFFFLIVKIMSADQEKDTPLLAWCL